MSRMSRMSTQDRYPDNIPELALSRFSRLSRVFQNVLHYYQENRMEKRMQDTSYLSPHDLLIAVRDQIVSNPSRHDQEMFIGNAFSVYLMTLPVEDIQADAGLEIPKRPANVN